MTKPKAMIDKPTNAELQKVIQDAMFDFSRIVTGSPGRRARYRRIIKRLDTFWKGLHARRNQFGQQPEIDVKISANALYSLLLEWWQYSRPATPEDSEPKPKKTSKKGNRRCRH